MMLPCRLAQNWFNIPEHWVDYGVPDLLHLNRRTNNILERWFQTFKYDICGGKISSTLSNLITTIFERVLPRLINDRALKGAGRPHTFPCTYRLAIQMNNRNPS